MSFDWAILHWIQNALVCPALDFLMPKISLLGDNGAIWLLAAGILLITKKYRRYGVFLLAGLAAGVLAGNVVLKNLIARPEVKSGWCSQKRERFRTRDRRCLHRWRFSAGISAISK